MPELVPPHRRAGEYTRQRLAGLLTGCRGVWLLIDGPAGHPLLVRDRWLVLSAAELKHPQSLSVREIYGGLTFYHVRDRRFLTIPAPDEKTRRNRVPEWARRLAQSPVAGIGAALLFAALLRPDLVGAAIDLLT